VKNAGLSVGRLVGLLLGLGVLTGFWVMIDGLRVGFPKDGLLLGRAVLTGFSVGREVLTGFKDLNGRRVGLIGLLLGLCVRTGFCVVGSGAILSVFLVGRWDGLLVL